LKSSASHGTLGLPQGLHPGATPATPGVQKGLILRGFLDAVLRWRRGREKDPKILTIMISESYRATTSWDGQIITETVPGHCTRASSFISSDHKIHPPPFWTKPHRLNKRRCQNGADQSKTHSCPAEAQGPFASHAVLEVSGATPRVSLKRALRPIIERQSIDRPPPISMN
jgi:hypothetical protein